MYWLITNRNVLPNGFGGDFSSVTYWTAPVTANPALKASWTPVAKDQFRQQLVAITDQYPSPLTTAPKDQKQVTFFVHGYNEAWPDAMALYQKVVSNLYSGLDSLGECISFDWPSKGYVFDYLPDRSEARQAAQDLADVMSDLYDWMLMKQYAVTTNRQDACKAKTSVIAHSMGNYVLENAMNYAWTQKNRPLLVSLIQEALMVAADVDNDLFRSGEAVKAGDGEGIANLTYRVTALYSGRDAVLGASAGLKHFGKRRLGRSGLDRTCPVPDNVWDIDCSQLIAATVGGLDVHSSYFDPKESNCYPLMRELLQGIDRSVVIAQGLVPTGLTKAQTTGA
jgi:esterase/lipase superfamily enzyme